MVTKVPVAYELLAVDLAFAYMTWKCQGATCAYIIALFEPIPSSPRLKVELCYVTFSRVSEEMRFRCFPLSKTFRRSALRNLHPDMPEENVQGSEAIEDFQARRK
jgi:hypothetical protein